MKPLQPGDDELSDLLRAVNVRSTVFCLSELGAPWGLRVEPSPVAKFHLLLAGTALLTVDGDGLEPVALEAGDLVLLAHGSGHVMQDRPKSRVRPLDRILLDHPVDESARMTYGGRGAKTSLLCGGFETALLPADLVGLLPRVLVLDAASAAIARWIEPLFGIVREENDESPPGSAAVLAKIADVFLTDVIRRFLSGTDGLLAHARLAAGDPVISAAVRALRERPDATWTVASLARHVGMSRTAFASRFRQLVGQPPMTYLATLRLSHGAGLLVTGRRPVREVARMVGYDNEASFSKAFKRSYGQSPGAYRDKRSRDARLDPVVRNVPADGPNHVSTARASAS